MERERRDACCGGIGSTRCKKVIPFVKSVDIENIVKVCLLGDRHDTRTNGILDKDIIIIGFLITEIYQNFSTRVLLLKNWSI